MERQFKYVYNNLKNCAFAVSIELTVVWDEMNLNSQNRLEFLFFTLLRHNIASVNSVVVRALHRRIIVYRIL